MKLQKAAHTPLTDALEEKGYRIHNVGGGFTVGTSRTLSLLVLENMTTGKSLQLHLMSMSGASEKIYLTGKSGMKRIEAEKMVADGLAIATTQADIYCDYYGISMEDIRSEILGYGKRTESYLASVMQSHSITDIYESEEEAEEGIGLELDTFSVCAMPSDPAVWVAQRSVRISIDDYIVQKIYFSHRPNSQEILTAEAIISLRKKFRDGQIREVFECESCGHSFHWLDTPGSLSEKAEYARNQYCGQC